MANSAILPWHLPIELGSLGSEAALSGHGVLTTAPSGAYVGAALSGAGVLTAKTKRLAAAALPGHGALTATAHAKFPATAAVAGLGVLTAPARMYSIQSAAVLAGTGLLTATAHAKFADVATLTGHGALSVVAKATKFFLGCSLTGVGSLTSTTSGSGQRSAVLAGQGLLSAAARMYSIDAAAALAGHGVLAAAAYARFAAPAAVGALGVLSATAESEFTRAPNLAGHGVLAGACEATEFGTAVLTGRGVLASTAETTEYSTATLTGHGALTATASTRELGFSGGGTLTCEIGSTNQGTLPWVLPVVLGSQSNMATLTGSGMLTAVVAGSAMLAGNGALGYVPNDTGALTAIYHRTAALHGHGRLSLGALTQESADLAAQGTLTADSVVKGKGKFVGRGSLTSTTANGLGALPWILPIALGQPPNAAVLTGSGMLTADIKGASTLSGNGALGYVPNDTGALTAIYHRTAALHGHGSVLPPTTSDESAALAAQGMLTTESAVSGGGRRLVGHGEVIATAVGSYTTAVLTGVGTLTGTIVGSATLGAAGVLAPVAFARYKRSTNVAAAGHLTAHAYPAITSLSGHGALAGLIVHRRRGDSSSHGQLMAHVVPAITPVLITHNGKICNITHNGVTKLMVFSAIPRPIIIPEPIPFTAAPSVHARGILTTHTSARYKSSTNFAAVGHLTATTGTGGAGFGQAIMSPPSGYTSGQIIFQDTFPGTSLNLAKWDPAMGANNQLWDNLGRLGSDANGFPYTGPNTPFTDGETEINAKSQIAVNNGCTITLVPNTGNLGGVGYAALTGAMTTVKKPGSGPGVTANFQLPSTGTWYVQARCKMPDMSHGIGPGLWFMPGTGSSGTELDAIQGAFGFTNSNFYPFLCGWVPQTQGLPNVGVDTTQAFHVYGVELSWSANTVKVYFDGTLVFSEAVGSNPACAYEIIVNLMGWSGKGSFNYTTAYANGTGSYQIAEIQAYAH